MKRKKVAAKSSAKKTKISKKLEAFPIKPGIEPDLTGFFEDDELEALDDEEIDLPPEEDDYSEDWSRG